MNYATGLQEFIDRCNEAMAPDFYTHPLAEQRQLYDDLATVFHYEPPASVAITEHRTRYAGLELRVRAYLPANRTGDGCILYIRGGGFVVGSLDSHQSVCAELADRSGLLTVAADFRLSPEWPFPAALEDCYGGLCALLEGRFKLPVEFDPGRLVIAGDSSGANMAVSVSMMARDRGRPALAGMALISPVLDFSRWRHGGDDAPLLTGGEMEYYTACYCPDISQALDPLVSPLIAGTFDRLPPTYIMSAELDSLRVDAVELANRLRGNGVPVTNVIEPGLVHSAVRARGYSPAVAAAWQRFCVAAGDLTRSEVTCGV